MPLPKDLGVPIDWVADGVGMIAPPAGYHGATSMVLDEGTDVLLVDAGLDPAMRRKLSPHVDVCLLTHCHAPHAHGARDFREVWAPKSEARAMFGVEDFLVTYGVGRRDHDLVAGALRRTGYEPSPVHKQFRAGGIIKLEKSEWRLLATPGHSQGHVALLDEKRHILFAGDLDGEGPPWYGYPTSDPSDLERTASMLADVPVAVLLTSHQPPRKRGIKPLFRQMAESIRERDRTILAAMETPRTLDELTDVGLLGPKATDPVQRYHQRVMVEKHLARLMEKDFAAARQDGRFMKL
ncbi:MAG TPA: MBL fold metallo-hydrolase [Candidatus Thermoplasmatota archaeon]|nr:MBL fold metallo-hydrolase [Candidatus Thermoplasmatota archaeon]